MEGRSGERAGGLKEKCRICDDDGWYAHPEFADEAKQVIRIIKVACPRGCPNKNNEPNVLPTIKVQ
jgi:hypothetical protein